MEHRTLYQKIQDCLRNEIMTAYAPGDLLPGERRLAERFGVSIMTVREALQGLAQAGFVERRQGVGTTVLDRNRKSRNLPVGILIEIDVVHPNTSPSYLALAVSLKRNLEARGHRAQIFFGTLQPGQTSSTPTCAELLRAHEEQSIKALVVLSWTTPSWRNNFESIGIPVIRFGNDCPCGVRQDHSSLVVNAVKDLIAGGRRKLALLAWEGQNRKMADELSEQFKFQLKKAGLSVNPAWICTDMNASSIGAGWEGMREIWLSGKERPDGILIPDDVLLRSALMALDELNVRVPEDLAICSASMHPDTRPGAAAIINYELPMPQLISLLTELTEERLLPQPPAPMLITIAPHPLLAGSAAAARGAAHSAPTPASAHNAPAPASTTTAGAPAGTGSRSRAQQQQPPTGRVPPAPLSDQLPLS